MNCRKQLEHFPASHNIFTSAAEAANETSEDEEETLNVHEFRKVHM